MDSIFYSTPRFVIQEEMLIKNLEILKKVMDDTGCKILLAQKAYSIYQTYPLISKYLSGTTASGIYEARLGKERFGGETHIFSPAYIDAQFRQVLEYADHVVFNSVGQAERFAHEAKQHGKSTGLRVNPECSTQKGHAIYDPCAPGSRLGCTIDQLEDAVKNNAKFSRDVLPLIDGLHFHTLCEQNSDDLETTAKAFEEKFGKYLRDMKWVNFGGGHHITRGDYDIERLERIITHFRDEYDVQVYLEPGEAVVLNAGIFETAVIDIVHNGGVDIAILNSSAACHTPDVIEMPYTPPVSGAGKPGEKKYTYRLAGCSCLAGDVFGDYSFDEPLKREDKVVFEDMALYTMVKTNTFNGIPLPPIYYQKGGVAEAIKVFGYDDFESRL